MEHQSRDRKLKVLFLPLWYPDADNQASGIFTEEHARAAALSHDIRVLYLKSEPARGLRARRHMSRALERGVDVYRFYYRRSAALCFLEARATRIAKPTGKSSVLSRSFLSALLSMSAKVLRAFMSLDYCRQVLYAYRELCADGWTPDIIHAHVYAAGFAAIIAGRIYDIPVVVTEHLSTLARGELNVLERFKARVVARHADAMLPVSPLLAEALLGYGANPTAITVVPNVIDCTYFFPEQVKGDSNNRQVLAVLSNNPGKGFDCLIEALAIVAKSRSDLTLRIVGVYSGRYESKEMARELIDRSLLEVSHHIDRDELATLMRSCDFLVHPSSYETFGIVVYEALACEKPVVAARIQAFEGVLPSGCCLLVRPQDPYDLAEGIKYMLDHYASYDVKDVAADIVREYGYERVGCMLDEVYRRLA